MAEDLLSSLDIQEILATSKLPKYLSSYMSLFGGYNDIVRVSPKMLILVQGNNDTGYQHILKRHNPYIARKFKEGGKENEIETQNLFSANFTPIIDILLIADEVYNNLNFNLEHNKRSEELDLYIGSYADSSNEMLTYKLLLYKGTTIIHTLYPIKNKFRSKIDIKLQKMPISGAYDYRRCLQTHTITYKDRELRTRAEIMITYNFSLREEKWRYNVKNDKEEVIFSRELPSRALTVEKSDVISRIHGLQFFDDLSTIEKEIQKKLTSIS